MGRMRAVLKPSRTLVLVPSNPLVASGPADVVSSAEFGVGKIGELGLHYEAGAFVLHG
jgi:hypothetical protein